MTSPVRSIRRRTLVACLAVASLAGATGALASIESGSDYAAPEVLQLGYGPGGPPSTDISTFAGLPEGPIVVACDASDDRSYMDCGDALPSVGIPAVSEVPRCIAWEDAAYMDCD